MTVSHNNETAERTIINVPATQISICCPALHQPNWNLHPRVYLNISQNKKATCPYCSQQFVIKN